MEEEMQKLVDKHACVKVGRVHGLAAGFDLIDKNGHFICQTHEAPPPIIRKAMFEEGLITLVKGHHVHCTPPLIINEEQIREGFSIMSRVCDKIDQHIMA